MHGDEKQNQKVQEPMLSAQAAFQITLIDDVSATDRFSFIVARVIIQPVIEFCRSCSSRTLTRWVKIKKKLKLGLRCCNRCTIPSRQVSKRFVSDKVWAFWFCKWSGCMVQSDPKFMKDKMWGCLGRFCQQWLVTVINLCFSLHSPTPSLFQSSMLYWLDRYSEH